MDEHIHSRVEKLKTRGRVGPSPCAAHMPARPPRRPFPRVTGRPTPVRRKQVAFLHPAPRLKSAWKDQQERRWQQKQRRWCQQLELQQGKWPAGPEATWGGGRHWQIKSLIRDWYPEYVKNYGSATTNNSIKNRQRNSKGISLEKMYRWSTSAGIRITNRQGNAAQGHSELSPPAC